MRKITGEEFVGKRFGRLVVLRPNGFVKGRGALVECQCDCGQIKTVNLGGMRAGDTQSCGCRLREMLALPTPQRVKSEFIKRRAPQSYEAKRASQKRWVAKNRDKARASGKRFRERHKGEQKVVKAASYQRHKHKLYAKLAIRFKTDLRFRIEATLRSRIRKVLKRQNAMRAGKLPTLLGCSLAEFKSYIASLFTEGMTWEKLMSGEIHIDHKVPCRAFDLRDPEQQARCFHFSNHQPLWWPDNLAKADKMPDGSQARSIKHASAAPVPLAPA